MRIDLFTLQKYKKPHYKLTFKNDTVSTLFLNYIKNPQYAYYWAVKKGINFDRINIYRIDGTYLGTHVKR